VRTNGFALECATVRQTKTYRAKQFERQSVDEYSCPSSENPGAFLFIGCDLSRGLIIRQYARLVDCWVANIGAGVGFSKGRTG